ncbi:MAG: hypothetical protein IKS41_06715 [Alphaproteobacteria bacterium]|nr:hypothetical protein [Alphaproteobacteria bacterium]
MENTLDVVQIKCSLGTQKMVDFLAASPDTLTESERDIQEALAFIYRKNEEKGLFGTFPDWRKNSPLIIDCTYIPDKEEKFSGNYASGTNKIRLEKTTQQTDLINILSHELKHAEQTTKEVMSIVCGKDNLAIQETGFFQESQSYPFGFYVSLLKAQEENATDPEKAQKRMARLDVGAFQKVFDIFLEAPLNTPYAQLEEKLMIATLPIMYRSSYKAEYDTLHPLGINDKGLSQIPESFPLKQKPSAELLAKLLETPKEPYRNIAGWLAHNQKWEEATQKISETGADGKYTASKIERFTLFQTFLEADERVDFSTIIRLLKAHDKNGDPLIDDVGREEFLKQLSEEYNKRGILDRIFKRDKTAKKFRLLRKEQNIFPSVVIQAQLDTSNPIDTSPKGLKQFDSEQQKKLKFLSQVTQIPEDASEMVLKNAVALGLIKTADTVLNQVGISRPYLMKILKSQTFSPLIENVNKTQHNNQIQVIHDILNQKDKSGHPVISEQDVQMLICRTKNYKTGNTSLLEEAFQIYQQKNPRDQRFISSDAIRFQAEQTFKQELAEFRKKRLSSINGSESEKQPETPQLSKTEVHTQNQTTTGINNTLAKTQNPAVTEKTPHPTIIPPNLDPRNVR